MTAMAKTALQRVQQRVSGGYRVIFVHVPKCGGTSLREALKKAYTLRGLGASLLDPVASKRVADALDEDLYTVREQWILYEAARARHNLIMGHFPCPPALREIAREYVIVTVLREPRAQLLSEFYYNRDKADGAHFGLDRDTTLKDFLAGPVAHEIGARYVAYFTSGALRATPGDPAALDVAKGTLADLDVVGTLEDLDAFADALDVRTGRRIDVARRNESPTPPGQRTADLDDEARELLDAACRPNQAMYEFALTLR